MCGDLLRSSRGLRVKVELVSNGDAVLDDFLVKLLLLINVTGSILRASRILKIPYSRAWEYVRRAEKVLGSKIVTTKRGGYGGGGTTLTELGKRLTAYYLKVCRRTMREEFNAIINDLEGIKLCIYAGSHDLALEKAFDMLLKERKLILEGEWLGSSRGVAALMLGEADIAGLHIPDPKEGSYNLGYLRKVGLSNRAVLIQGYRRLQGFITREEMGIEEIVLGLLKGRLRLINRVYGSGTRILLDQILTKWAGKLGINRKLIPKRVLGYDNEVSTHTEVAEAIVRGEADVGLAIEAVARKYGLNFTPIMWECFDFVTTVDKVRKGTIKEFIRVLRSEAFLKVLEDLGGYEPKRNIGSLKVVI